MIPPVRAAINWRMQNVFFYELSIFILSLFNYAKLVHCTFYNANAVCSKMLF